MTLTETLIVAALLGVSLFAATLGSAHVRDELKRRQTWSLLKTLDEALDVYYAHLGRWPDEPPRSPGTAAARPPRASETDASDAELQASREVLRALDAVPASRVTLERIPSRHWRVDADGRIDQIHDGWGRPLICLTRLSPVPAARHAVEANGGKPVFVSAGPDGRVGRNHYPAAADNLVLRPSP